MELLPPKTREIIVFQSSLNDEGVKELTLILDENDRILRIKDWDYPVLLPLSEMRQSWPLANCYLTKEEAVMDYINLQKYRIERAKMALEDIVNEMQNT